MKLALIMRN